MPAKNTLIINLFGGPGTGKSTGAAHIFAKLKMAGVDAELVTEFAKDKTWEANAAALSNQFYILGKQSFRLSRVAGQVDVIITDSPLLLSTMYLPNEPYADNFKKATVDLFNTFNNVNYYLRRVKAYNPNGRNQTELEANAIAEKTRQLLDDLNIKAKTVDGDVFGYELIAKEVLALLKMEELNNV